MQVTTPGDLPLSPPDLEKMAPTDVLALLAGGTKVNLGGFSDRAALRGSWTNPATPFIPARQFDRAVPLIKSSKTNWRMVVALMVCVCLSASFFGAGVLLSTALVKWETAAADASPPWRMTQVLPTGVMLSMQGQTNLIPIGAKLPNGDVVVSVFPNRNVVVLETATVMLRSPTNEKDASQ